MSGIDNTGKDGELLRRQTLDLLRFPLALVVLTVHIWPETAELAITNFHGSVFDYPLLRAIKHTTDAFFRWQSVPIYFFISGYVFFYGIEAWNRNVYLRKLKNRVKTLLIPYIIWNTLAICVTIGLHLLPGLLPSASKMMADAGQTVSITPKNIAYCYFYDNRSELLSKTEAEMQEVHQPYVHNGALWFLRELMLLVLCTPLLYALLKRFGPVLLALLTAAWFAADFISPETAGGMYLKKCLLPALYFFSFGAYMSIAKRDMLAFFGRFFRPSLVLYPLLALLYIAAAYLWPEACDTIKRMNVIAGLFFAYNVAAWLLKNGKCRLYPALAASAFFIYVSHGIVVGRVTKGVFAIVNPATDLGLISVYALTEVLSVALLLGSFLLLRRYAPALLKVLTGRK